MRNSLTVEGRLLFGKTLSSRLKGRFVELATDEILCNPREGIRENVCSYADAAEVDAEDEVAEKSRTYLIDIILA
jgi:hypothetical protein